MDSLHAIGFYASSGVLFAGALGVALLPTREWRGIALAVTGVGLAGVYSFLSAGFAAGVALVSYLACALILATPAYRPLESAMHPLWRQLAGVGAAVLLAALAYSAFRGDFNHATFYGGALNTAALGRLLFEHDALATEAIAGLVLVTAVGAVAAAWRVRDRPR